MEIYMSNISWTAHRIQVTDALAAVLHKPPFASLSPSMNFYVRLFKDQRVVHRNHSGCGVFTLPTKDVGNLFLSEYGEGLGYKSIFLGSRKVRFAPSKRYPRQDVLEIITRTSFLSPVVIDEQIERARRLDTEFVHINVLQFGWECRDYVFSIESEESCEHSCFLCFNEERRELQIKLSRASETFIVAIRFSHIQYLSAHVALSSDPVIYLSLEVPPSYEKEMGPSQPRKRLSFLPIADHERVAPYCSQSIRLICSSLSGLTTFRNLCKLAKLHISPVDDQVVIEHRELFSQAVIDTLEEHLRRLNWVIAFQVEALVKEGYVNVREMIRVLYSIQTLVRQRGKEFTIAVLRHFKQRVMALFWDPDTETDVLECFKVSEAECRRRHTLINLAPLDSSLFNALHVTITPTTILLEGPFLERSNRVIRSYMEQQDSFIRVNFADEGHLQFRFDREINGVDFIRDRIGPFLLNGLQIAGRTFHFLAYSQSALKEHAVWLVSGSPGGNYVDASVIINSLGVFDELPFNHKLPFDDKLIFDTKLIYCPARYAARLSQAFTATDASVSVGADEIFYEDDIHTTSKDYCFTDGVGTFSTELAREIGRNLKTSRRGRRSKQEFPPAIQIRLMGSKGMLSVNHKLRGRAVVLRPSMIKFIAQQFTQIEIARAFDRPTPYFLNRPLIMLLEGLGVPYEVFEIYQKKTIEDTRRSTETLEQAARLFEGHGLGTSFRLASVLLNLSKLGLDTLPDDTFFTRVLEYGVYHILRELKNHARIPVPGAWTLVGVADIHKYLQPNQIFVCIKPIHGAIEYLEGPVLISRSPTIHPGDVQVAHAIGKPPKNSCFAIEPLPNTVVFSVVGDRPLPSALGGGDLDGDLYNILPLQNLPEFSPTHPPYSPAKYAPAPKKMLDRPSTMKDVAEFVMEFISSDVVGIIAINWLIIADQSPDGILDKDCLALASLHSDAVDYPKSGQPVAVEKIPRLKSRLKPDWNAPETVNVNSEKYYPSQRAIGKLFRDIKLPNPIKIKSQRRARRPTQNQQSDDRLADTLSTLNILEANNLELTIQNYLEEFTGLDFTRNRHEVENVSQLFAQYAEELYNICSACTLSHSQGILTEQEAMVGTILQKTSQPRKRKDTMSKLREQTDILVRGIRQELAGDPGETPKAFLQRSWLAWELATVKKRSKEFGAESFAWVSLGAIFEAVKELKEAIVEEDL
ncbi:RNA-directed RNA polymerase 2 [Cyathus striatus]|nr:RNA-directed RNA polymerase 2 [Cyathus striatus]